MIAVLTTSGWDKGKHLGYGDRDIWLLRSSGTNDTPARIRVSRETVVANPRKARQEFLYPRKNRLLSDSMLPTFLEQNTESTLALHTWCPGQDDLAAHGTYPLRCSSM